MKENKKHYCWHYSSPSAFSDITLVSDEEYLTGLYFDGSNDQGKHDDVKEEKMLPVFEETIRWLDRYFEGKDPGFVPKYRIENLTPFREEVIEEMLKIPYGETTSYGTIAKTLAEKHHIQKMSAQAVGNAVGWNPICLIIPCHRVIGTDGSLTGYGGGLDNKIALLKLEKGERQ